MSGDVHVRFCEGLGVKLPGATHPLNAPTLSAGYWLVLDEVRGLEQRIAELGRELKRHAGSESDASHLMQIPGVGLLTATAMVAAVPDPSLFRSARHFASGLGLTPRESNSGQRRRLGRISKRGNTYLRTLLIHGARAALN